MSAAEQTRDAGHAQWLAELRAAEISETVTIDGDTWTVTGNGAPNPLAPTVSTWAITPDGAKMWVNGYRRTITPAVHTDGCRWGTSLGAGCTCAPRVADPAVLYAVARDIAERCTVARMQAEEAERIARLRGPAEPMVRLPAGCEGCPSARCGGVCTCC